MGADPGAQDLFLFDLCPVGITVTDPGWCREGPLSGFSVFLSSGRHVGQSMEQACAENTKINRHS